MAATTSWFERAVRVEQVKADLTRAVPELADGSLDLTACRMIRLRAGEVEGTWHATYLLDVTGPDGATTIAARGTLIPPTAPAPEITSAGAFGADGWRLWLAADRVLLETTSADDALPGLAALTDPARASRVLDDVLRSSTPERRDLRVAGCTTSIASYKPGVRVTMCCDLEYSDATGSSSWPSTVVAKANARGESPAVHEAQVALWASSLATSTDVTIAEPYGFVDALSLSVQGYLDHDRTLKDLLATVFDRSAADPADAVAADGDAADALRATAVALAAVHTCGVGHGETETWDAELASHEKKHDKLTAAVPWLAEHTAGVLARLATAGGASPADPLVASHGSFRTAQVLLRSAGPIGIIDFDKLRLAEPAADIGPFLSKLRHTAVNKGDDDLPDAATAAAIGSRVDVLRATFVEAYRARATVTPQRLACWEGLEYFSLVLGSAKKGLRERAASCATMLHDHLDAHGI